MKPSEAHKALSDSLAATAEHLPLLDDAVSSHENIAAELKAATDRRDKTLAEMRDAATRFEGEKKAQQEAHESLRKAKARELKEVQGLIDENRTTLATLTDQVKGMQAHHDAVVASLDSVRKQLNVR